MPPTVLTVQTAKPPFTIPSANGLDFTFAAADVANGNSFRATGREVLLAQNTGGSNRTITVTSVPTRDGRTGDITNYSLGAGEFLCFTGGLTVRKGWRQTNGSINVSASHADIKLAVLRLPKEI